MPFGRSLLQRESLSRHYERVRENPTLACWNGTQYGRSEGIELKKELICAIAYALQEEIVVRGEEFKPDSRPSRSIPATLLTSLGEVELKKLLQNQQLWNPHLLEEGLLVVVRLILLVAVSGKKTSSGLKA